MAIGDTITKLPTGSPYGIMIDGDIAAICGSTTTMYIGFKSGYIKSLTTAGVLANLTTKVKLPGRIVALLYTGLTAQLTAVMADGKIYNIHTDGSAVAKIADLNMGVCGAYYYSNNLYVVLDSMQQEKSSLLRVNLT